MLFFVHIIINFFLSLFFRFFVFSSFYHFYHFYIIYIIYIIFIIFIIFITCHDSTRRVFIRVTPSFLKLVVGICTREEDTDETRLTHE